MKYINSIKKKKYSPDAHHLIYLYIKKESKKCRRRVNYEDMHIAAVSLEILESQSQPI